MNKYLFYIILFLLPNLSFSQYVKVNAGRSISSVNSKIGELGILNKPINTHNLALGIDFLETENYFLSNELSYTLLGGREENLFIDEPLKQYEKYSKKWSFLSLSSSFRYKFNFSADNFIFLGAGAKVNFAIGSKTFSETLYEEAYTMKSSNIGFLSEIGFVQNINRLRVGLVGSYLHSLTPYARTEFNTLKINPIAFNLTIGYKL